MVKPSGIMHWLWEVGGGFEGEGKKMIHVTMGKYSKKIKIILKKKKYSGPFLCPSHIHPIWFYS